MRRRKSGPTGGGDMLGGTLDMMILGVLLTGRAHGFTIAASIQQRSDAALLVEQGSLYPALHRLEARGWIKAEWGTFENNRRARFYALTAAGKRQLHAETDRWQRLALAVGRVMRPVKE